jgi:hypothetical protein
VILASFVGDLSLVLVGFWLGTVGAATVVGCRELVRIRQAIEHQRQERQDLFRQARSARIGDLFPPS